MDQIITATTSIVGHARMEKWSKAWYRVGVLEKNKKDREDSELRSEPVGVVNNHEDKPGLMSVFFSLFGRGK